jgi:hypothetical protein
MSSVKGEQKEKEKENSTLIQHASSPHPNLYPHTPHTSANTSTTCTEFCSSPSPYKKIQDVPFVNRGRKTEKKVREEENTTPSAETNVDHIDSNIFPHTLHTSLNSAPTCVKLRSSPPFEKKNQ